MWDAIAKAVPQLSAVALVIIVLGGVLFWILYKTVPRLQDDFKETLEKSQARYDVQSTEFRNAIDRQQTAFLDALSKERHAYGNALNVAIASNNAIEKAVNNLTVAVLKGSHL